MQVLLQNRSSSDRRFIRERGARVADGGDGGYNEASSGAAPGTFEAGNYDYKDLLSQINAGAGWELYWDDNAQASYVYNAEQDIFSSFGDHYVDCLKGRVG